MHNIPALHKHEAVGHVRGGSLYSQEDSGGTMLGQGIRTDVPSPERCGNTHLKEAEGPLMMSAGIVSFLIVLLQIRETHLETGVTVCMSFYLDF